jgi:V/A-type H+-transporting ATPase subunit I
MRLDVKKYLFWGLKEEIDSFFRKAQQMGCVHFIESNPTPFNGITAEVDRATHALKILRSQPVVQQVEPAGFDAADSIIKQILALKREIDALNEQERILTLEIARIEPFGHFQFEDLLEIENAAQVKVQFFFASIDKVKELPTEVFYVNSSQGLDYFIALNQEPKAYDKLVEMQIEKPLAEEIRNRDGVKKQIRVKEQELKGLAKYNAYLHRYLNHLLNNYNREKVEHHVDLKLDDQLFSIQGWVPVNKAAELDQILNETHAHAAEIEIEPNDRTPTYLENEGLGKMGEDLVHIYDTPSSTDRDPSLWVLFSFIFFFALIIGDGGYGLVLVAIMLYLRYRYSGATGFGKRFLNLATILTVSVVVWGVLTNSFFGLTIPFDSPLRKVSLLNWLVEKKTEYHIAMHDSTYAGLVKQYPELQGIKDPVQFLRGIKEANGQSSYVLLDKFSRDIMMELALLIGVVHLTVSFARYLDRNLSGIGWIMFLVGGFLYFPIFLGATTFLHYIFYLDKGSSGQAGFHLMIGGIVVALFFAIIKYRLLGLTEGMNVIQVFGDVMSYLRIYALGLAGGIVSTTINDLTAGLPIVIGLLIALIGHAFNIALGIMGAVIHGLRLNFLEWYHYSFEGGGKLFNPLRLFKID